MFVLFVGCYHLDKGGRGGDNDADKRLLIFRV